MSSRNVQLPPIVLQGPKLSSTVQECQKQIDLDQQTRLFSCECKRLSFPHVIIKRPFKVQIWHVQLHVKFTLCFQPRTVQHSPVATTNFSRALLFSEPLICPTLAIPLELTLQLMQTTRPHRDVSSTQHAVKTKFVFQRILRTNCEHFGERSEL